MNQPKIVDFEFTLDNIVCVKAPEGTNPDTLLDAVRKELLGLIDDNREYFIFHGIWDDAKYADDAFETEVGDI